MITIDDLEKMGYYASNTGVPTKAPLIDPMRMVKDYAKKAGQPLGYPYEPESKLRDSRMAMVAEEFDEVLHSYHASHNLKELADLVYVAYGYAATFGWDLTEALARVHQNNLDRMTQDNGEVIMKEGKVVKNPNTPPVNLKDLV